MSGSNAIIRRGIVPFGATALADAVACLRAGGIVGMPTETVYGLAADASSPDAVARIYRAKGRPSFNPLIVHVRDAARAVELALVDEVSARLIAGFWPGPLTLLLPRRADAPLAGAVTAGLPKVALRMPAHRAAQALLRESGLDLAAPSANRSGGISPTRAVHVAASLGRAAPMILDDGACSGGIESTIVAVRDGAIDLLRPGPVTAEMLAVRSGMDVRHPADDPRMAPGQLASHYAPVKPLRLDAEWACDGEWLIGFGEIAGDDSLSVTGDLAEAAARLFDCLHRADAASSRTISVAPVPHSDIGAAINDRLRRAAT